MGYALHHSVDRRDSVTSQLSTLGHFLVVPTIIPMTRLLVGLFCPGWCAIWITAFVGCSPTQFTTLTIYETPQSFVRLEVDRTLEQENGHSHPASLSPDQMAAVLRGITVQEPLTRIPFYDDVSVPRTHRAFTDQAVAFWAPLLSLALSKATEHEIVTFYQSTTISGTSREVTSGGVFVDGERLHLVLSNLRSGTHVTADIGIVDTLDDRLTPMKSIAPQRGKLLFNPESAHVDKPAEGGLARVFQEERRELIVLYKTIPSHQIEPSAPGSESPSDDLPPLR